MGRKNKQGDKGHITSGRYCKIYNSPSTSMLKECKTKECQNKLQQLQCKKQGIEEDHVKSCSDEVEKDSATV